MPHHFSVILAAAIILFILFFLKTKRILDLIFLIPLMSYSLIFVAIFSNVPLSYLETSIDQSYYITVVSLDVASYTSLFLSLKFVNMEKIIYSTRSLFRFQIIFGFGVSLVLVNLVVVAPYFGQAYMIITSKHTPLSEIGWIIIALFIVSRRDCPDLWRYVYVVIALVIISLPFGARMQPSFGIMALFAVISSLSNFSGKLSILILFFILSFSSLLIGILRDLVFDVFQINEILYGFNQGAIFRTSSVILQYIETLTVEERIASTLNTFFLYPLTGKSLVGETVFLNYALENFTAVQGNGGNFGVLAFYYFGWYFPIVIFVITLLISRISILRFFVVVAIISSFRWQQYNFVPLLRIAPMLFILSALVYIVTINQKKG